MRRVKGEKGEEGGEGGEGEEEGKEGEVRRRVGRSVRGMLHTILSVQVMEDIPAGGQIFADYGDAFWAETKVDNQGLQLLSIFHISCYTICMRAHLYKYINDIYV